MAKSIAVHQKRRRGRPATGRDPAITVRVPQNILTRVEKWAKANNCSRSTAVAVMLEKYFEDQ
jgi:hypothetical protein